MYIDRTADNAVPARSMIQQHLKPFLCVPFTEGFDTAPYANCYSPIRPSRSIYHIKQYISFCGTVHVLLIFAAILHLFCCSVVATRRNSDANTTALLLSKGTSDAQSIVVFLRTHVETGECAFQNMKGRVQEGARMGLTRRATQFHKRSQVLSPPVLA